MKGTPDFGLVYEKGGEDVLIGYLNIDYVGDPKDRKNMISLVFFHVLNLFCWDLHKQTMVPLSSCEVEYAAATTPSCQGLRLA